MSVARQVDRGHAVAGLADDEVAQVLEHLAQVHARDRLVFGDQDARVRHSATYSALAIHFGNETTARTPCPLTSSNSPLRSSRTRLRTICRPRPPWLREVEIVREAPAVVLDLDIHAVAVLGQSDHDTTPGQARKRVLDRVLDQLVDDQRARRGLLRGQGEAARALERQA